MRLLRFFKNFFLLVFETIKQMKTLRGILALFISFMIFAGWAYLFMLFGVIFKNAKLASIGALVAAFWAGPFTPLIPLVILVAFLMQRYVFRDRSNDEALKAAVKKFKESGFKTDEDIIRKRQNQIRRSNLSYQGYLIGEVERKYYEDQRK